MSINVAQTSTTPSYKNFWIIGDATPAGWSMDSVINQKFAVNPNNDESKFEKLTTDSLNFYLESKFVNKQNIKFLTDNSKNPVPEIKESRIGLELWRYMISLALICALAEMWIGRQN